METGERVLGTVDQLLINNCIRPEVRNQKQNLVVAYSESL